MLLVGTYDVPPVHLSNDAKEIKTALFSNYDLKQTTWQEDYNNNYVAAGANLQPRSEESRLDMEWDTRLWQEGFFHIKSPKRAIKIGWLQDIMSNITPLSSNSTVKVSFHKVLNHPPVPLQLFVQSQLNPLKKPPEGERNDK